MKGIIALAGSSKPDCIRLPSIFRKQLMPIYDKLMVYYTTAPLRWLVSKRLNHHTPEDSESSSVRWATVPSQLFGRFECVPQPSPDGLAWAFIIGEVSVFNKGRAGARGCKYSAGHGFLATA